MDKKLKGFAGEELAVKYLLTRKFEVLQQNWYCRWGEIDVIAEKNDILIFIEVKFRSSDRFGNPHQALTATKLKALKRSIWRYLSVYNLFHKECRLDVICIYLKTERLKLKHYKSVTF